MSAARPPDEAGGPGTGAAPQPGPKPTDWRQAGERDLRVVSRALSGGPAGGALVPRTPVALLEAEFPAIDRGELARLLLHHLRFLAVVEAWLDFAIGKGLELLSTRFDLADLGFSHQQSFAEGPCGFSAAHGRELRRIARLLPGLPALCQAFLAGLIPRTRLREVLTVATPETDAGWAQLARTMGTRPLARLVAAVKAGKQAAPTADAVDPHQYERVGWLGTSADRSTWRFGLALVRQVAGVAGPDHVLAEALAAETLASVGPPDDAEADDDTAAPRPLALRSRQRPSARHRAPNARRLARLARRLQSALAKPRPDAVIDAPDWGACADAWEAVDHLLMLLRQRRSLDWERSRLLSWMDGRRLQQELGFGRFTDATERLLGARPSHPREPRAWQLQAQARIEEDDGVASTGDDERRGLRLQVPAPEGLGRRRGVCCVAAPR